MSAVFQKAALAATASFALFTSSVQASTCWNSDEITSFQLRDFHLMTMVGTLQCRYANPQVVELYNAFIMKKKLTLDTNARILKGHFSRQSGEGEADRSYDSHGTVLANNRSSNIVSREYCERIEAWIRTATLASDSDLLILAQAVSEKPAVEVCPANYAAVVAPLASAGAASPPASVKPAVAEASTPPTLPASPGASTPAQIPAAATPQTASADGREEAMKAAITALQAATAALQAASSTPRPAAAQVAEASRPGGADIVPVKVEQAPSATAVALQ